MAQPAPLVANVPTITISSSGSGGRPPVARTKAHRAGTIKINRPAGLSQRSSRTIAPQGVGGGDGLGRGASAVMVEQIP
ncbi:MAG: hypothetical protein Fur0042_31090 [Cyanophyceae cyanobacterium]